MRSIPIGAASALIAFAATATLLVGQTATDAPAAYPFPAEIVQFNLRCHNAGWLRFGPGQKQLIVAVGKDPGEVLHVELDTMAYYVTRKQFRVRPYGMPERVIEVVERGTCEAPSVAEPAELGLGEIVLRCEHGQYLHDEYEIRTSSTHRWASFGHCPAVGRCAPEPRYRSRTTGDLDHYIEFYIDKDPSWKMRIEWRDEGYSVYHITQERDGRAVNVDAGFCRESRDLPQLPAPVPVRQSADALRAEIKVVAPETREKAAVITVSGHLNKGDNIRFFDAVEKIQNATVYLESPGGNTYAGVGIGEIIHERGFHTAVLNYGHCLSACANAWLGGTKRYVGGFAEIGFHHPTFAKDIVLDEATGARAMEHTLGIINAYVVSMLGLSKDAAGYVTVMFPTNPKSVNYLTPEDGERYGIAFTRMNIPDYDPLP